MRKKKNWQPLQHRQRERKRNRSNFRQKLFSPLVKQTQVRTTLSLYRKLGKLKNSRKKCLNRLAMSILGSPSLPLSVCLFPGPCSLPTAAVELFHWNTQRAGRTAEQGGPLFDHVVRLSQWECGIERPPVQLWKAEYRGLMERERRRGGWSLDWEKERKKRGEGREK